MLPLTPSTQAVRALASAVSALSAEAPQLAADISDSGRFARDLLRPASVSSVRGPTRATSTRRTSSRSERRISAERLVAEKIDVGAEDRRGAGSPRREAWCSPRRRLPWGTTSRTSTRRLASPPSARARAATSGSTRALTSTPTCPLWWRLTFPRRMTGPISGLSRTCCLTCTLRWAGQVLALLHEPSRHGARPRGARPAARGRRAGGRLPGARNLRAPPGARASPPRGPSR